MNLFRSRPRVDVTGMTPDQARELAHLTARIHKVPHDLKARRQRAELYRSVGRISHAVAEFQAVAGAYAAQGLLFRAIAICKLILELDPNHDETHRTLAALYAKQELPSKVIELPAPMGAALIVEDDIIEAKDVEDGVAESDAESDAEELTEEATAAAVIEVAVEVTRAQPPPPPAPLSDEGQAVFVDADTSAEDIVDAAVLAALTMKPEGSVVLHRPQAVPLFSGLSERSFGALVQRLRAWQADVDAVIVAEGEPGDSLFVVSKGRVRVERRATNGEDVVLGSLGEGDFFGEIALVARVPRAATVVAIEPTELLEIPRDVLDELVALDPQVREVLDVFCTQRLVEATVKSSPLFVGDDGVVADSDLLARVVGLFSSRVVEAGTPLVQRGGPSDGLHVILAGNADVSAPSEIGVVRLKELVAGDVFGEMSLLSGQPAMATVTTTTQARISTLPRDAFERVQESHPWLSQRLRALSESRGAFNSRFLPSSDVARPAGV
jgi:cAMP-dependent protein kinase regulator